MVRNNRNRAATSNAMKTYTAADFEMKANRRNRYRLKVGIPVDAPLISGRPRKLRR